jgi:hypothetical protein
LKFISKLEHCLFTAAFLLRFRSVGMGCMRSPRQPCFTLLDFLLLGYVTVPPVGRLGRWRVSMDCGIWRIGSAVETDSKIRGVFVQNALWARHRPCPRMGRYVEIYWSFLI